MQFLVNSKNARNEQVAHILKKTSNSEYGHIIALTCDFWFLLYDETTDELIAECSVSIENDNVIEINDVLVFEKFRGQRYSELLIMNVLYHFGDQRMMVKICCENNNIPAYRCYLNIFGLPYQTDIRYSYFALKLNDTVNEV